MVSPGGFVSPSRELSPEPPVRICPLYRQKSELSKAQRVLKIPFDDALGVDARGAVATHTLSNPD